MAEAKPALDLGAHLFEQMRAITDVQAVALKLGRQQMALEVLRLLRAEKDDGHAIARIAALCTREAK